MKKLRFYARGTDLVTDPRLPIITGQPTRRIAREFVPAKGRTVDGRYVASEAAGYRPTEAAFELPDDGSDACIYVKRRARDKSLWCADEYTARACGVEFTPVEFVDGEWVEAKQDPPKRKTSAPTSKKELTADG